MGRFNGHSFLAANEREINANKKNSDSRSFAFIRGQFSQTLLQPDRIAAGFPIPSSGMPQHAAGVNCAPGVWPTAASTYPDSPSPPGGI